MWYRFFWLERIKIKVLYNALVASQSGLSIVVASVGVDISGEEFLMRLYLVSCKATDLLLNGL